MPNRRTWTCVVITLLVYGGMAAFFAWLFDSIKSPTFTINEATITGYNFTPTNHLNSTFILAIRSHNRDPKYSIQYEMIVVSVHKNGFPLAFDTVLDGPFIQHHGVDISFEVRPLSRNVPISDPIAARDLRSEAEDQGQLKLEVRVRAAVRFEVKGWKHMDRTMKVICFPVLINLTSGNPFEGAPCNVYWF